MRPGKRFGLSANEKNDIWGRWKAGQSLHEIGRAFDRPHSSIRYLLLPGGGIPPAARRRSRLALTLAEREDISRGIASGSSLCEIARHLDRAVSTVSREITRHGGRPAYRAHVADDHAWDSVVRPKRCLLAVDHKLRDIVASKLILDWSPEQISGWLKTRYPDDESMSKETEAVVAALSQHVRKLPATLKRSLTWDRGLEMAKHRDFTVATDVQVYFCDPQSPWQRGTNENTNLLLRQYFPRGTDLSGYSQAQLDQLSLRLNQRPRKTLGFESPASKLQASVAPTI